MAGSEAKMVLHLPRQGLSHDNRNHINVDEDSEHHDNNFYGDQQHQQQPHLDEYCDLNLGKIHLQGGQSGAELEAGLVKS